MRRAPATSCVPSPSLCELSHGGALHFEMCCRRCLAGQRPLLPHTAGGCAMHSLACMTNACVAYPRAATTQLAGGPTEPSPNCHLMQTSDHTMEGRAPATRTRAPALTALSTRTAARCVRSIVVSSRYSRGVAATFAPHVRVCPGSWAHAPRPAVASCWHLRRCQLLNSLPPRALFKVRRPLACARAMAQSLGRTGLQAACFAHQAALQCRRRPVWTCPCCVRHCTPCTVTQHCRFSSGLGLEPLRTSGCCAPMPPRALQGLCRGSLRLTKG